MPYQLTCSIVFVMSIQLLPQSPKVVKHLSKRRKMIYISSNNELNLSEEFPESKVMKHQQQKLTFVNLMRHFTTRSEKRWFLAAKLSLDAGEGHLEGSNGRKRLIRTTKDEVRSALSCTNNHQLLKQETRRNHALLCKK